MRAELGQLMNKWANDRCSCGWAENRSTKYKVLHTEYGPLRMLEVPIVDIVKKMEAVPNEERKYHSSNYRSYYHEVTDKETLPGQLKPMKKKASICVDCVRNDTTAAVPCKFPHE